MPKRRYVSSVRSTAAAEKRDRVLEAATKLLREHDSISAFSLDAVARAAGVTRLTVYRQFGSRRGLLEEVFDEIARQGGLLRITEAMAMSDPRAALERLVEIFCQFWSWDAALGRVQQATAIDPELADALLERNERRRKALHILVARITSRKVSSRARRDAVDLLFALTSFAIFAMLRRNRSADQVCALIKSACNNALNSLQP